MIDASYWSLDDDGDLMNISEEEAQLWANDPECIVFEAELCVPMPRFILPKITVDTEEFRRKLREAVNHGQIMVMPPTRLEAARNKLNSTPWWRPIKRQEAAREYKEALITEAINE